MAMPTVQQSAQKYAQNAGNAGTLWQEGAARFEGDPTALAAQQAQKAQANYAAAITSGRWARALGNVGRQGWLNGVQRPEAVTSYQAGTSGKGQAKWAAKMNLWFPVFDQLSRQINAMPKNTPQDSINRVAAWINGTIAAKQNL